MEQKISRKDEHILKRLDKIEVALILLLDELVDRGAINKGESVMLKQMVSNRK